MKKASLSLITGGAAVLITILAYVAILHEVEWVAIHFITLAGVVIAEIIATLYAYLSQGNPRRVAVVTVSILSVPIALILSIVYIRSFPEGYVSYICWYLVLIIVVNVIAAILYKFDAKSSEADTALQQAKQNMLNLRKTVKMIQSDPAAASLKPELDRLEEKLHFSNDTVISPQDQIIYNMLIELRGNVQNPGYDCHVAIANIERAIEDRNILCSRTV